MRPTIIASLVLVSCFANVASAVVTSDTRGSHGVAPGAITFGLNLDGVVSFEDGARGTIGTGALISDRHILTAAHLIDQDLDGVIDATSNVRQARFVLGSGEQYVDLVPSLASMPVQWTANRQSNSDLAIVVLAADAPVDVPRYSLYGLFDELGKPAVVTGHGSLGEGAHGGSLEDDDAFLHAGLNRIEAPGEALHDIYDAEPGATLVFDFDSGQPANNTLSLLGVPSDLGFGDDEVGLFLSDSGGPLFVDKAIAGVNQAIFGGLNGDVTADESDGSWGELQYVTRVSSFREFIMTATSGQAVFVSPSSWAQNASGNWQAAGNWTSGIPNAAGSPAIFGPVISTSRTVTVDGPITVGRITFDNSNTYTLAGAGTITLDVLRGEAEIDVVRGSHVIGMDVELADDTVFTITPATGSLSITGALNSAGKYLTKVGAGTLTVNNIRAAGLSLSDGTVAIAHNTGAAALSTSVLGTLSIAGDATPTARLDLGNNAAIINYSGTSPAATVRQQILAGRGGPGFGATWSGPGIASSAAAAAVATDPESRSIAYAENSTMPLGPYTTFGGQPIDDTSILIAFTRTGDANLDGVVNDDDVTIFGATYAPGVSQPSWSLGDFDYNGFVDDDDATLLGVFFDPGATPLVNSPAEPGAPLDASGIAAVPEPSGLMLMLIPLALLVARRRLAAPYEPISPTIDG